MSRRSFLRASGQAAALGAVASTAPQLLRPAIAGAQAALPSPKGNPIEHIVVLMMENRSFDHYLGSLSLEECRNGVRGLAKGMLNVGADGRKIEPFHMTDYCQEIDPPHGFSASKVQFANGTNGGYLLAMDQRHPGQIESNNKVMGYYTRADLPFLYGVADEFVICDRYFSSHGGSTFPNRHYMHCAQSFGIADNRFSPNATGDSPTAALEGFRDVLTIFDRLDEAGIPWAYYFVDLPFVGIYSHLRTKHPENFRTIDRFYVDAAAGRLPAYTVVDPSFAEADDHPSHHVQLGQLFIASIYNALSAGRGWEKTAFFVNYDEDGGFFDHMPHERFPDDRDSTDPAKDFSKSGGRIPGVLMSPWAKKGYVYKDKVCHASILGFVEWRFGLRPMTKRDAGALAENRIFLDAFDFTKGPRELVQLPVPAFDPRSLSADCFGGDFFPEFPETKIPGVSTGDRTPGGPHEELFDAADTGMFGDLDQRDKAHERVLRAAEIARAGNGGRAYVAAAPCPAPAPAAQGSGTAPAPAAPPRPAGELPATGNEMRDRITAGVAALGAAAAAAEVARRARTNPDAT